MGWGGGGGGFDAGGGVGGGGGVKIPNHCPKLPFDVSFPNPSTGSGLTIPTPV